ncbi:hypothetical protein INT45_013277 [Circinella minor]|uniref:Uncharacterized protein n=1 Tax=Circinella minor TaxID=1195481 RepID=A0A8H7S5I0_9FUNG|nr:hypothetical protein INT45_013277 [Circinella minor]
METFSCNGYVNGMIDRLNCYVRVTIEHSTGHRAAPSATNNNVDCEIEQAARGVEKILGRTRQQYSTLGFTMPLFRVICEMAEVEEFHVDSIYKTNRTGHELFSIVASVNGIGLFSIDNEPNQ